MRPKKPLNELGAENFLMSMDMKMSKTDQIKNAILDSAMYRWSSATHMAILDGIDEAYAKKGTDDVNGGDAA